VDRLLAALGLAEEESDDDQVDKASDDPAAPAQSGTTMTED
jgi:hypothetical protein